MTGIDSAGWLAALREMFDAGFTYLDYLTAIDRVGSVEIVVHLLNPDSGEGFHAVTGVPPYGGRIDSITSVYPGANWHERETAEMFGVEFAGHPDPRPLLLRTSLGAPPLRKSTVLAARVVTPWPGAAEPGADGGRGGNPSRRRQRPPGVPDNWLVVAE